MNLANLPPPCSPAAVLLQLPAPATGALETWLISAMAVASLVVMGRKLFVRKRPVEAEFVTKTEFQQANDHMGRELTALRDRIDSRFLGLVEKIDQLKSDLINAGEQRSQTIHGRLNELESGLARVDERTRHRS